jgi:hypothetical protein
MWLQQCCPVHDMVVSTACYKQFTVCIEQIHRKTAAYQLQAVHSLLVLLDLLPHCCQVAIQPHLLQHFNHVLLNLTAAATEMQQQHMSAAASSHVFPAPSACWLLACSVMHPL